MASPKRQAAPAVPRSLTAQVLASWADMRGTARWLLDRRPSEMTMLWMVLAAGLFSYLGAIANLMLDPERETLSEAKFQGTVFGGIVMFGLFWVLIVYLLALLSHGLARLFGGKGGGADSRAALAWTVLVTAPVALVATIIGLLVGPQAPALAATLQMVGFVAFVYAFGQCIAEAHGFRSGLAVSGVLLAPVALAVVVAAGG